MLFPLALSSSARYLAADVPVMPLPTMHMSASAGSCSVVRCPIKNSLGSLCQKELLDFGVGSVARSCIMLQLLAMAGGGRVLDGGEGCGTACWVNSDLCVPRLIYLTVVVQWCDGNDSEYALLLVGSIL